MLFPTRQAVRRGGGGGGAAKSQHGEQGLLHYIAVLCRTMRPGKCTLPIIEHACPDANLLKSPTLESAKLGGGETRPTMHATRTQKDGRQHACGMLACHAFVGSCMHPGRGAAATRDAQHACAPERLRMWLLPVGRPLPHTQLRNGQSMRFACTALTEGWP